MCRLTLVLIAVFVAYASGTEIESKIVGGSAATIENFKYQVSLQKSGSHFCGGSIYNNWIIVTAAHCLSSITDATTLSVRYGSADYTTGGTLVKVSRLLIHPSYNSDTMLYDVAILKVASIIVQDGITTKSVYLADAEPANSTSAKISGWGTLNAGDSTIPTTLQWASVKMISRTNCNSATYGYVSQILSTMICAAASGIDTCQGDSGGPLVYSNGAQVGITSWGYSCALPKYPGVYTSVATVKSWITTNAKALINNTI